MRYKYIIEIDTSNAPVIIEQRITHIMTTFFDLVGVTYIPENIMKITREDLPEKTLEERIAEKGELKYA